MATPPKLSYPPEPRTLVLNGHKLAGLGIDAQGRCHHYNGPTDVLALRQPCCAAPVYYACYLCHEATAGHAMQPWPRKEFDEKALLCGHCGHTFSIKRYLEQPTACPHCGTAFNPGCATHHNLYFQLPPA